MLSQAVEKIYRQHGNPKLRLKLTITFVIES